MERIIASVGRGGQNRRDDVMKVQRLINAKLAPHQRPLAVDGVCGALTMQAIAEYQQRRLNLTAPDGRVDPSGPTLHSLNQGTGQIAPPVAPVTQAQPGGNVRSAMDFFTRQGWTTAQAAGIVANLVAESNLQPGAQGDGGQAYGLAQWHRDRQDNFRAFSGRAIQGSTVEDQLRFVQHELTTGNERGAGNRLRNAASADDAGSIVSQYYERPADRQGEATRRGQRAAEILTGYSNQTATH